MIENITKELNDNVLCKINENGMLNVLNKIIHKLMWLGIRYRKMTDIESLKLILKILSKQTWHLTVDQKFHETKSLNTNLAASRDGRFSADSSYDLHPFSSLLL